MTAWSRVEARVRALAGANDVVDQGIDAALSELVEKGLIENATRDSVSGLRQLRNLADHSPGELPASRAREFVAMADAIIWVLGDEVAARTQQRRVGASTAAGEAGEIVQP